jgi:hypothetical protein
MVGPSKEKQKLRSVKPSMRRDHQAEPFSIGPPPAIDRFAFRSRLDRAFIDRLVANDP